MQKLTDHIHGEIRHVHSAKSKYGHTDHTVTYTDDTTGEDVTCLVQETEQEHTTGWGYNEKTVSFTALELVFMPAQGLHA